MANEPKTKEKKSNVAAEVVKATRLAGGKRAYKSRQGIDRDKLYSIEEAVKLVKSRATAKFDETIEIAMNLGIDSKQADQTLRGVCALPHGSGRKVRVAVFAKGDRAEEAKKAGADHRRCRGPRRCRPQGHHRLRPLHRHPRPDAAGRPARQGAGSAQPDAESRRSAR